MKIRLLLAALVLGVSFGCGSSSPSSPTPAPSASTVSIVMNSSGLTTNAYSPNPITVAVGTTVTWMNNDTVTHTATGNTGLFDSGPIAPNQQFSRTFSTVGSFPYHCTIHPGMVGTVTVQ
ncbi:MAG TPA: plastocyanin/azurin family copper-binding protein [Vicinamibacterales bacterium]